MQSPRANGSSPSPPDAPRNGSTLRAFRPTSRKPSTWRSAGFASGERSPMAWRAREAVAPAYLFPCLIAGGSVQGIWANMVLQLLAIAILAWAALATSRDPLVRPARQLLIIVSAGFVLIALQLIPLPSAIWPSLGGRSALASGFRVLGLATPAFPLSLSPYDTLRALLALLPPLAMLCAMVRLKAYRPSWLAIALLAGTFPGILPGALQVAGGNPETWPWYLFEETNPGFATGFFANANHMATLLVIALPFLAALPASAGRANVQGPSAPVALVAGAALVIIVGVGLNRSLAGYVL